MKKHLEKIQFFFTWIRVPRVTRVFEKKDSSNRVIGNRVIWIHYLWYRFFFPQRSASSKSGMHNSNLISGQIFFFDISKGQSWYFLRSEKKSHCIFPISVSQKLFIFNMFFSGKCQNPINKFSLSLLKPQKCK